MERKRREEERREGEKDPSTTPAAASVALETCRRRVSLRTAAAPLRLRRRRCLARRWSRSQRVIIMVSFMALL